MQLDPCSMILKGSHMSHVTWRDADLADVIACACSWQGVTFRSSISGQLRQQEDSKKGALC